MFTFCRIWLFLLIALLCYSSSNSAFACTPYRSYSYIYFQPRESQIGELQAEMLENEFEVHGLKKIEISRYQVVLLSSYLSESDGKSKELREIVSKNRLDSIRNWLLKKGIPPERIYSEVHAHEPPRINFFRVVLIEYVIDPRCPGF